MLVKTTGITRYLAALLLPCLLAACAGGDVSPSPHADGGDGRGRFKVGNPYVIDGTTYTPQEDYSYDETGVASWYGPGFHGRYTANGEVYDQTQLTGAHRTLPMPSLVRVTNLDNGKSIVVRINDRGPFARSRIMDMSSRSADLLDFKRAGTAKVRVQILSEESRAIAEAARAKGSYDPGNLPTTSQTVAVAAASNVGIGPTDSSPVAATSTKVEAESLAPLVIPEQPVVASSHKIIPEVPPSIAPQGQVPTPQQIMKLQVREAKGTYYPEQTVQQSPPLAGAKIYVQAGAFSSLENAQRLQKSLNQFGSSSISEAEVGGRIFQRVRIGPFPDIGKASAVLSKVLDTGEKSARVVVDR